VRPIGLLSATLGVVVSLSAATSHARILANLSRAGNFQAATGRFVPLDNRGSRELTFNTATASKVVVIRFSAECANGAADTETWVDIDIVVDGIPQSPTNHTSDAFCTSDGIAGIDEGWVRAAVVTTVEIPAAGEHIVKVRARSSDAVSQYSVSDVSILVHD
jgi:hypothetical protein